MNLYIDDSRLAQFAENEGRDLSPHGFINTHALARSVNRSLARLRNSITLIERLSAPLPKLPQQAEWLLDNRYIAEREAKSALRDIKHANHLPASYNSDNRSLPLVFLAANALTRSSLNALSPARIETFLEHFQNSRVLSELELSLFFPMLKLSLISALSDLAHDFARSLSSQFPRSGDSDSVKASGTNSLRSESIADPYYGLSNTRRARPVDTTRFFADVFSSLRLLAALDASALLDNVSRVERLLCRDPAKSYPFMTNDSRALYRRQIASIAKRLNISEFDAASKALKLAEKSGRHVGFYIFSEPLGTPSRKPSGRLYATILALAPILAASIPAFLLHSIPVAILTIFPFAEIFKNLSDFFILKFTRPRLLPRLELKDGIPNNARTLCVVTTLLSDPDSSRKQARLLEEYRLANRDSGSELLFAILADFKEASQPSLPSDSELLLAASSAVDNLNSAYGGGFFLLSRERTLSPRDKRFMGWERKRGAITELIRLIKGVPSSIRVNSGSALALRGIKYLILLDSDTRLTAGAARELAGTISHPLNAPVVDPKTRTVTSGHAILQPRIALDLAAANRSDFTRLFAGQGGIDPYGSVSSDLYQDLFDQGSFAGKGILSVDAFFQCLDHRFPLNSVLSHDLIEGAYLRSAFLGDVELSDSYPSKVSSYFERAHRWIRGDWQSAPWLFPRVRTEDGSLEPNPISPINKWKIFDNLRRSLTPIAVFAAFVAPFFAPPSLAAISALSAAAALVSPFILAVAESITRPGGPLKPRYKSRVLHGASAALMRSFVLLILLPFSAFTSLSAISTALWRMHVSKRNMLAWTTAAESDSKRSPSIPAYYLRMLPVIPISALFFLVPDNPAAASLAILWLLSPALAFALSLDIKQNPRLNPEDALFVTRAAADIWRFFERLLTPARAFLPPDNWQEEPAAGTAERTSPTNIGLALLAPAAAHELSIISKDTALNFISNTIATIERLPKWNGHLFNWYDTRSRKPLEPRYVSSVDSGNFVGCLITLSEILCDWNQPELRARVRKLINDTPFAPLYDPSRKLFFIGFDVSNNAPSDGWYDLMASEARMTSFIAVARGDVPKDHWKRLGRTLTRVNGRCGMVSWTGTMFEYFMPNLLMPAFPDSLIHESLSLCLNAQISRSRPWGISESSFFSFDPSLAYQYKAHGVQGLALKRGMDKETIISPYSTFLALPFAPAAAVRNLRLLRKLGLEGRFGFYEAADFTPSRTGGRGFEPVKSYMAHHLGMSLIAALNALRDGFMQERFIRDPEMAAFAELLQEKGPVGQLILPHADYEPPEKPQRLPAELFRSFNAGCDPLRPKCLLLSNGAYSLLISDTGRSRSSLNSMRVLNSDFTPFSPNPGFSFFLASGTDFFPLTPEPEFDPQTSYHSEFSGSSAKIFASRAGTESTLTSSVPQSEPGELRTVFIRNTANSIRDFELICSFEPVLASQRDFESHPAFSKLSLDAAFDNASIFVERRPASPSYPAVLCFSASEPFSFDTSKELSLGRGGLRAVTRLPEPAFSAPSPLDPAVTARVCFSLRSGESIKIRFALAVTEDRSSAFECVSRILRDKRTRGLPRLDFTAKELAMSTSAVTSALARLSSLVFPHRQHFSDLIENHAQGVRGLWRFGISGDFPLLSAFVFSDSDAERAISLIKEHSLLSRNGFPFDLALITDDKGSYSRPLYTRISDALRAHSLEHSLNSPAGIHLIDFNSDGSQAVAAMSDSFIPSGPEPTIPDDLPPARPYRHFLMKGQPLNRVPYDFRFNSSGTFTFDTGGGLNAPAWSHVLSNGSLSCTVTDAGTGSLWLHNAREGRINRWINDPLADLGSESLELFRDGRPISLFAAADGYPCSVSFGFGFARWLKKIGRTSVSTTIFIHPSLDCRILTVETDNPEDSDSILYFTELSLASDPPNAVITHPLSNGFSARNLDSHAFPHTLTFLANRAPDAFTCDRRSFLTGSLDAKFGAGLDPCFAASFNAERDTVFLLSTASEDSISHLLSPAQVKAALKDTMRQWQFAVSPVTIETPLPQLDRYINGWAIYQTLACRIFARGSIYQSGGAFGFRDQLQDVCALIDSLPALAARQILLACRHQYSEGDVMHWWHQSRSNEPDKGVRTRCSDDLLWLPYAVSRYTEKTGDFSILHKRSPFIVSDPLRPGEHDRYEAPPLSSFSVPVLDHCLSAINLVLARGTGSHGLLLIGSGDWNDGFNLVGADGNGESVWLTWFAAMVIRDFAPLCSHDSNLQARLLRHSQRLADAANNSWDGQWFTRGFFDDASPLGSSSCSECRIDSLPQSFAAISQLAPPSRVRTALISALRELFDRDSKIAALFTPPFSNGDSNPGYIKAYLPGVRENGGQYTHAAVWLAKALLTSGFTSDGLALISALLPLNHDPSIYKAEPFILAADVYSNPSHYGRAGWSWYTGAAAWFFRTATEDLLGFRSQNGALRFRLNLPASWRGFSASIRLPAGNYRIKVDRASKRRILVACSFSPATHDSELTALSLPALLLADSDVS